MPNVTGDVVFNQETATLKSSTRTSGGFTAGGGCALITSELNGKLIWINVLLLFVPAFIVLAIYIKRRRGNNKKFTGRAKLLAAPILTFALLSYGAGAQAANFNVSTPEEFRQALATSESNGQDDTVFLEGGVYDTGGTGFSYSPAEDNSLTVIGAGAGVTILDAGGSGQVVNFNTVTSLPTTPQTPITDDNADIIVSGLTVRNGSSLFLGAAQVRTKRCRCDISGLLFP